MMTDLVGELHEIAEDLIGKPFAHMGRGPEVYDCLGLVLEVHRRLGFNVGDPVPVYGNDPGRAFVDNWASFWKEARDPKPGDAVLVRRISPTYPDHIGILMSGRRMLHCGRHGVVIERLDGYERDRRICGYFRPRETSEPTRTIVKRQTAEYVNVTTCFGPFSSRQQWIEPKGKRVREYVPSGVALDRVAAWIGTRRTELDEIVLEDDLFLFAYPGIPAAALVPAGAAVTTGAIIAATAINIAIGTALSLLASLLSAEEAPTLDTDEARPTFNLGGARNTVANGTTVPIVYGRHKVAGQIIGLFYRANSEFRSTLWMLIALSEGEVQSVAGFTTDQTSIPSSAIAGTNLTINGNPASGFPGCRVSIRLGSLTQSVIPGFEETVTANVVDITLSRDGMTTVAAIVAEDAETYVYTTVEEIDAFEVNFRFPTGLYSVNGDGDVQSYPFYFTMRYRLVGATTDTVEFVSMTGSFRADHTRTIRRSVATRGKYRISFTRSIINDEDTERRFSVSQISTINEIRDDGAINYGGKALLAIETLASNQISGSIPTVNAIVEGKKVYTWDGVSLTSPTLTYAYSNNPAWVALDALLSKRYGIGAYIRLNDIDLQRFKDWADECDETVTTDGVMHPRHSFNYVFDQATRAFDALATIALAGRATIIYSGRKLSVRMERASSPVQMFGMGNIVAGSMSMTYIDTSRRANFIEVEFVDEDLDYDRNLAQLESTTTTTATLRKETTRIAGITDPHQAYRAAKYILNVAELVTKTLRFDAPVDALNVESGDVFYFSHDVPQIGKSGRMVDTVTKASDGIIIDRDITVATGDKVTVRLRDDSIITRTLTAGTYTAGDSISPTTNWDVGAFPQQWDPYSIGPDSSRLSQWKCIRTQLLPNLVVRVEAVNYDAAVYDDDPGEVPESTDAYPDSRRLLDNPANVRASETVIVKKDGGSVHIIDVSFSADVIGVSHDVWWRYSDTTDPNDDPIESAWRFAGTTRENAMTVEIGQSYGRTIQVSVCPRNVGQTATAPEYGAKTKCNIVGKFDEPQDVTGLSAEYVGGRILLRWTPVGDSDLSHYEIRANSTDEDWAFAQVIDKHALGCQALIMPPVYSTAFYLLIKAVNRSGIPSRSPAALAVTARIGASKLINSDVITTSDWTASGTSDTNFTLTGSTFRSDASATSAQWTSDADGYPLLTKRGRLHLFLSVIAWDFDTTYSASGYPWSPRRAERFESDGHLLDIPDPERVIRDEDATFDDDSPTAATMAFPAYDWATNWKVLLEYRLSTDTTPSTWDDWKTYTGPFEFEDRYYVQVRVTYTNTAGFYRIDLDKLTITTTLSEDYDVVDDFNVQDHFTNVNGETGELGILGWNAVGSAGFSSADGTKNPENHPGVVIITTAATTSNYAALNLGTTGVKFIPDVFKYHRYEFVFETDESASCDLYIGFANGVSTTTPGRLAWIKASIGGTWYAEVKDSGSVVSTAFPTISFNGALWYHLVVEFFGESEIRFTLRNSSKTETVSHTSGLPTDTAMTALFKIVTTTNSGKAMNIDLFTGRILGLDQLA